MLDIHHIHIRIYNDEHAYTRAYITILRLILRYHAVHCTTDIYVYIQVRPIFTTGEFTIAFTQSCATIYEIITTPAAITASVRAPVRQSDTRSIPGSIGAFSVGCVVERLAVLFVESARQEALDVPV